MKLENRIENKISEQKFDENKTPHFVQDNFRFIRVFCGIMDRTVNIFQNSVNKQILLGLRTDQMNRRIDVRWIFFSWRPLMKIKKS